MNFKKHFKLYLAFFCIGTFLFSALPANAFAPRVDRRNEIIRNLAGPNDLFCDDFSLYSMGEKPIGYTISQQYGTIETAQYKDKFGNKNVSLRLSDTYAGSAYVGVDMLKNVSVGSYDTVLLRMKFMVEKTEDMYCGLRFGFMKNGQYVTRYDVFGLSAPYNGGLYAVHADNNFTSLSNGTLVPGEWYTVVAALNVKNGSHAVRVESEVLKTPFYSTTVPLNTNQTDYSVDTFHFGTNQYSGKYYIDYIKVEVGNGLDIGDRPRPEPIIPLTIAAPIMREVPFRNNVCIDGKYKYFTTNPRPVDGDLIVSVEGAFRAFGLITEPDSEGLVAKNDKISVKLEKNSNKLILNGEVHSMDTSVSDYLGKPHISIGKFAKALGYEFNWNEELKVLNIIGGVENE